MTTIGAFCWRIAWQHWSSFTGWYHATKSLTFTSLAETQQACKIFVFVFHTKQALFTLFFFKIDKKLVATSCWCHLGGRMTCSVSYRQQSAMATKQICLICSGVIFCDLFFDCTNFHLTDRFQWLFLESFGWFIYFCQSAIVNVQALFPFVVF